MSTIISNERWVIDFDAPFDPALLPMGNFSRPPHFQLGAAHRAFLKMTGEYDFHPDMFGLQDVPSQSSGDLPLINFGTELYLNVGLRTYGMAPLEQLRQRGLLPKDWKVNLFAWGDVLVDEAGEAYVPFLTNRDGEWTWSCRSRNMGIAELNDLAVVVPAHAVLVPPKKVRLTENDVVRLQLDGDLPLDMPIIDCDAPVKDDLLVTNSRIDGGANSPEAVTGTIYWDRPHIALHVTEAQLTRGVGALDVYEMLGREHALVYGISALTQIRDLGLLPEDRKIHKIVAWADRFRFHGDTLVYYLSREGDKWAWRAALTSNFGHGPHIAAAVFLE